MSTERPPLPLAGEGWGEGAARDLLLALAAKYIWWKTSDAAMQRPERIVAQVMDIGDYDDVCALAERVGDDCLREVLHSAEAGQFNQRSWAYWHYRLGVASLGKVPPMPVRKIE